MREYARWIVIVVVIAVLSGIGVSLLPPTSAPDQATPSATPTQSPGPPQIINIEVAHGKVTGGGDIAVVRGSRVTLVVNSDKADEVTFPGTPLKAETKPGKPAALRFIADAPGTFEVVMSRSGLELARLTVAP